MPIVVKKCQWRQTEAKIYLQIPSERSHYSDLDILITPLYMKLSYPPFLYELFFYKEIIDSDAACLISENEISLEITKKIHGHWEDLAADLDKEQKKVLKEEAVKYIQNKTRAMLDKKIETKNVLKKNSIEESIREQNRELEKIKNIQEAEKKNALRDFNDWEEINKHKNKQSAKLCLSNKNYVAQSKKVNEQTSTENNAFSNSSSKSEFYQTTMSNIENRVLPPLRTNGTIEVSFSNRILPTPSRESTSKDEEIWMKKLNDARRASGFISEDLRPEERNPQWCKDKGDYFFRMGNYTGAINAYTHAIKLSDKLPSLYSNRAAAHFALGNFHKVAEDCSTALELMVPHCQSNLKSRIKCIVRRAAALTRIGMLSKAIEEMKHAIKIDPDNDDLKADLCSMEKAWEQNPDSD